MTNIEIIRDYTLSQFNKQMDKEYRNIGIYHTMQVVTFCMMISKKENLDEECCVIAAYLHDIATYTSHYAQNHASRSATIAKEILPLLTQLNETQIETIITSIQNHSTKEQIHDIYSEVLKTADSLSHYYSGTVIDSEIIKERLRKYIF